MAAASLPVGSGTLVYGSADAARTVHVSNSRMNTLMRRAGERANIKPHWVGAGDSKVVLYGPADIEGHEVRSVAMSIPRRGALTVSMTLRTHPTSLLCHRFCLQSKI